MCWLLPRRAITSARLCVLGASLAQLWITVLHSATGTLGKVLFPSTVPRRVLVSPVLRSRSNLAMERLGVYVFLRWGIRDGPISLSLDSVSLILWPTRSHIVLCSLGARCITLPTTVILVVSCARRRWKGRLGVTVRSRLALLSVMV